MINLIRTWGNRATREIDEIKGVAIGATRGVNLAVDAGVLMSDIKESGFGAGAGAGAGLGAGAGADQAKPTSAIRINCQHFNSPFLSILFR